MTDFTSAGRLTVEERIAQAKVLVAKKREFRYGLLAVLFAVLWFPANIALFGSTFSILWGWFVVPALHLPSLTYAQAYGILTVARFLKFKLEDKDLKLKSEDSADETFRKAVLRKAVLRAIFSTLFCFITLGTAWVFRVIFL